MRTKITQWTTTLLSAFLLTGAAAAEEIELPTASDILSRYIEAIGGEDLVRKHTSRTMKGTFEMVEMGISGNLEVYTAAPNLTLQRVELEGLGDQQVGFDGETAWSLSLMAGPTILEGEAKEAFVEDADFFADLHLEEDYVQLEVVGTKSWGGRECYEVEATDADDKIDTYYFEIETGLLRGRFGLQMSEMGELKVKFEVNDYQEFDGLLIPTVVEQKVLGQTQRTTFRSIEHTPLDAAVFALPEEIAVMVKDVVEQ